MDNRKVFRCAHRINYDACVTTEYRVEIRRTSTVFSDAVLPIPQNPSFPVLRILQILRIFAYFRVILDDFWNLALEIS